MFKVPSRLIMSGREAKHYKAYADTEVEHMRRKMRKLYLDRTTIDFDSIPELLTKTREPADTIKNLWLNRRVAGVVRARDGFPELNISHPKRDIHTIYRDMVSINSTTQPFFLSIDDDSDYFKVTIEDIHLHEFHRNWPMMVVWNRFIPGKPNRMKMRVVVDNWEASEPNHRGGRLALIEDFVDVDVYTENYPKVLKANMNEIVPGKSYTIRDLEKDLPDGIELAPHYKTRQSQALYLVQKTIRSYFYWEYLKHRFDPSSIVEVEMAKMNMEFKKDNKESEKVKEIEYMTKDEEEKLRKLADMLKKDFETMKNDIVKARMKKAQDEQKKLKEAKDKFKK